MNEITIIIQIEGIYEKQHSKHN